MKTLKHVALATLLFSSFVAADDTTPAPATGVAGGTTAPAAPTVPAGGATAALKKGFFETLKGHAGTVWSHVTPANFVSVVQEAHKLQVDGKRAGIFKRASHALTSTKLWTSTAAVAALGGAAYVVYKTQVLDKQKQKKENKKETK